MDRHQKTSHAMIQLYCKAHHQSQEDLCEACTELRDYAARRLKSCPFQPDKPPCSKCPVHCYKPAMRERIREVMRYAGPRMIAKHPVMAVRHLLDSVKKSPPHS